MWNPLAFALIGLLPGTAVRMFSPEQQDDLLR